MPESLNEFFRRRFRELQQSPEWTRLGNMGLTEFMKMLENEYYDCADDPVPPHPDRTVQ